MSPNQAEEYLDSILLAASIRSLAQESVLDIGCGVAATSLCLAHRVSHIQIIGLDQDRSLLKHAASNIQMNQLRSRIEVFHTNLISPPPRLAAGTFSHVMVQASHLESQLAPQGHKDLSQAFDSWAKFALLMVRPLGTITFIMNMNRLADVIHYFYARLGDIVVFPLFEKRGQEALKVIVKGHKNAPSSFRLTSGLTFFEHDNQQTDSFQRIIHHGDALEL